MIPCTRIGSIATTVVLLIALATAAWAATPEGVSPGAVDRIATIRGECPTFSWGAVAGSAFYELVVFELAHGYDPAAELELTVEHEVLYTRVAGTATAWTPELERCFVSGGTYVWFVRAVFGENVDHEAGDWSEGLYFSLSAAPSAEEVEQALDVLRRYVGESGSDFESVERVVPDTGDRRPTTRRSGAARIPSDPKDGERSVLTGPAAIRGNMPDPAGDTYGVTGVSNSPNGAGIGAANTAGGADLVLDGSAQGVVDAELSQSGIDRASEGLQSFDITNSGAGDMTLRVDGVEVVTTLTDQDTLGGLSCANSELAKWNGSSWACDEDLDSDTLAALSCVGGELAKWNGAQWSCDSDLDSDTLAGLSCGSGQVAKWNGSAWTCGPDEDAAPRQPGNQLVLSGNSLDVVEGPGSGLDADALDGFDSTAFSPLVHLHDERYFTETELSTSGAGGAVHWDNLTAVPAGFADGVDDDTTYSFGSGLIVDNGQIVIDPSAFSTRTSNLAADASYTSVAIGADGLALISYYYATDSDLKVAHCENIACTTAAISTLDSTGSVGEFTSMAIGVDGLGLISYYDDTNANLKVAHCDNLACTSATVTALDLWGNVGAYTSVAIGTDGLGLISYFDDTNNTLKVAHCHNVACTSASLRTVDSTTFVGPYTSVAIGGDGLGLISYLDFLNTALKVAHCNDIPCTSATISTLDNSSDTGWNTSLAIGTDGLGLIAYFDETHDELKVAHCYDLVCTSATLTSVDGAGIFRGTRSVAIGSDGFGLVSYHDDNTEDLKVAHCNDLPCTSATIHTVDSVGSVGRESSVAIGVDGRGLISYRDTATGDLKVAHLPIGY